MQAYKVKISEGHQETPLKYTPWGELSDWN